MAMSSLNSFFKIRFEGPPLFFILYSGVWKKFQHILIQVAALCKPKWIIYRVKNGFFGNLFGTEKFPENYNLLLHVEGSHIVFLCAINILSENYNWVATMCKFFYYSRTGSSMNQPSNNSEATLGLVNWGVVCHWISYKLPLPLNNWSLNRSETSWKPLSSPWSC